MKIWEYNQFQKLIIKCKYFKDGIDRSYILKLKDVMEIIYEVLLSILMSFGLSLLFMNIGVREVFCVLIEVCYVQ